MTYKNYSMVVFHDIDRFNRFDRFLEDYAPAPYYSVLSSFKTMRARLISDRLH